MNTACRGSSDDKGREKSVCVATDESGSAVGVFTAEEGRQRRASQDAGSRRRTFPDIIAKPSVEKGIRRVTFQTVSSGTSTGYGTTSTDRCVTRVGRQADQTVEETREIGTSEANGGSRSVDEDPEDEARWAGEEVADPATTVDPTKSTIHHNIMAVSRAADLKVDEADMDETVYLHEGSELHAEDLASQMALTPEAEADGDGSVTRSEIQVGDPAVNTPEEIERMRDIVWAKRHLCMGKRNALPPPAKGAICDIDTGGARPVAQRVRKLPPQISEKLFQL